MSFISDKAYNHLTTIPTQTLNLFKMIGAISKAKESTVKSFQISEFVSFKEYKTYLNAIKKDSTMEFYLSQFPDSNISSPEAYRKYISIDEYDDYPVLGITWESAMNFCRWKTLADNKDSIKFYYRLPVVSEWLAAYHYYTQNKIKNDMNDKYSDWLYSNFDEATYGYKEDFEFMFDYPYPYKKTDPMVLKRMRVIGDSYMFQHDPSFLIPGVYYFPLLNNYYYAYEGQRHVAFRYVKINTSAYPDLIYTGASNTDLINRLNTK